MFCPVACRIETIHNYLIYFLKVEEMIRQLQRTISLSIPLLTIPSFKCYTSHPQLVHNAQIMIRNERKKFLQRVLLNHNKIVLEARARQPTDTVLKVKQGGQCVGRI